MISHYRILVILFVFFISACQSGSNNSANETSPPDTQSAKPVLLSGPGLTPYFTVSTMISLVFSKSIDVSTLSLSGGLAPQAITTWQNGAAANDTLVITPNPQWNGLADQELTINGSDTSGNLLAPITIKPTFVASIVYVDAVNGKDENNGSMALPKKTIPSALAAVTSTPAAVLVTAGRYEASLTAGTQIQLSAGVILQGGFSNNFTQYDPQTYLSSIVDDSATIETKIPVTISANTTVDGFHIEVKNGDTNSVAITVEQTGELHLNHSTVRGEAKGIVNDGTLVMRQNHLIGGDFQNCSVLINNGDLDIEDNSVEGCTDMATASGNITTLSNFGTARIVNNRIDGGKAYSFATAIRSSGALTLESNIIDGGYVENNSTAGIGNPGTTSVLVSGPVMSFKNNAISGGTHGRYATAVDIYGTGGIVQLENNLIYGGHDVNLAYGVSVSRTTILTNNTIFSTSPDYMDQYGYAVDAGHNTVPAIDLTLIGNTIYAGTSSNNVQLYNRLHHADIQNNLFYTTTGASIVELADIQYVPDADATILNNTFYLLANAYAYSAQNSLAALQFKNNLISGSGGTSNACLIFSTRSEAHYLDTLAQVTNNNLSGCATLVSAAVSVSGATNDINVALTNIDTPIFDNQPTLADRGNTAITPTFVSLTGADQNVLTPGDNDWRLTSTSDTLLLTGGLDLSSAALSTDILGVTRTADNNGTGWSMGAFEIDVP